MVASVITCTGSWYARYSLLLVLGSNMFGNDGGTTGCPAGTDEDDISPSATRYEQRRRWLCPLELASESDAGPPQPGA